MLHAGWARSDARLRALFGTWSRLLEAGPTCFAELILATALSPAFLSALDDVAFAAAVADLRSRLAPGTDRHIELDARVDIRAEIARLRVPVLLLASDQDQIITPDHHDALVGMLPHARQAHVHAGHGAPAEAMPDMLEQIVAFADRHPNGAASNPAPLGIQRFARSNARAARLAATRPARATAKPHTPDSSAP